MTRIFMVLAMALAAGPLVAQENARAVRDANLQAGRYEMMLGKLRDQNEELMGQVRALQRANELLAKDVQAGSAKAQNVADEIQRLKNTQLQNINAAQKQISDQLNKAQATPWGSAQRDCAEIGVKHQQIKVSLKPDGSRSVRFLCFDGKALLLGSEVYSAAE